MTLFLLHSIHHLSLKIFYDIHAFYKNQYNLLKTVVPHLVPLQDFLQAMYIFCFYNIEG